MNLLTFNLAHATYSDVIDAQKALRKAKCYNGALDGRFGDYCRAGLYTYRKLIETGGRIAGFNNRSAILLYPHPGEVEFKFMGWCGPATIDGDGSGGNEEHDPCFQPDTSLHHEGRAINSRCVPGIVMTIEEIKEMPGICLGAKSSATHIESGIKVDTVVYDTGGPEDDGEVSIRTGALLGLNPSPIKGGTQHPVIWYEVEPGVPANIDGVLYHLTALNG